MIDVHTNFLTSFHLMIMNKSTYLILESISLIFTFISNFCVTAPQTEPPSIIIYPSQPVRTQDNDDPFPDIPDDPTPPPAHAPSGQSEDILYITLGVVLGAMLLVLIMFAVMCVWRAKQVNRDPSKYT